MCDLSLYVLLRLSLCVCCNVGVVVGVFVCWFVRRRKTKKRRKRRDEGGGGGARGEKEDEEEELEEEWTESTIAVNRALQV